MSNPLHKNQAGQPSVNGGHFAAKTNDEAAGVKLGTDPVNVRVRLEAWDGRENLLVQFDGRAILDARGTGSIDPDANDDDEIYFTAQRLGLVSGEHDGPFTVYLDDPSVQQYLDARATAGLTEPITGKPRRSAQQILEQRAVIEQKLETLHHQEFELAKDEVLNDVLADFPEATEIHLWDVRDNEFEDHDFRVFAVYAGEELLADATEVQYEHQHLSETLARNQAELLHQDPDATEGVGWFGLTV